jgi:hypothetical protein
LTLFLINRTHKLVATCERRCFDNSARKSEYLNKIWSKITKKKWNHWSDGNAYPTPANPTGTCIKSGKVWLRKKSAVLLIGESSDPSSLAEASLEVANPYPLTSGPANAFWPHLSLCTLQTLTPLFLDSQSHPWSRPAHDPPHAALVVSRYRSLQCHVLLVLGSWLPGATPRLLARPPTTCAHPDAAPAPSILHRRRCRLPSCAVAICQNLWWKSLVNYLVIIFSIPPGSCFVIGF